MAKTIKFNLICDGKPVRTIQDLQENFSIEDILAYYDNRLLHRWLETRGYVTELEKVSAISAKQSTEIIKELISIFHIEYEEKKAEEDIYILEFLNERKQLCALYEKENFNVKKIIDDYQTGYWQLLNILFDNLDDMAKIKAVLAEMVKNYLTMLELNHKELFWNLCREKAYLAIMCLLMNKDTRKYYMPESEEERKSVITATYGITDWGILKVEDKDADKKVMYKQICEFIVRRDFKESLGGNCSSHSGTTDGYWRDLEQKGKKYMIIGMGKGDYVRSAGKTGGDLSSEDIKNNFVIVDGIDYKSNSASRELLYMEV